MHFPSNLPLYLITFHSGKYYFRPAWNVAVCLFRANRDQRFVAILSSKYRKSLMFSLISVLKQEGNIFCISELLQHSFTVVFYVCHSVHLTFTFKFALKANHNQTLKLIIIKACFLHEKLFSSHLEGWKLKILPL